MVAFDRIGRVDQFAYLRRVLEITAQILSVIPPGADDDSILFTPFSVEIRDCGYARTGSRAICGLCVADGFG